MLRHCFLLGLPLLLAACGPPPGFTSSPPGTSVADQSQAIEACSMESWKFPKPQNEAVYFDCMARLGYVADATYRQRREELRAQGY